MSERQITKLTESITELKKQLDEQTQQNRELRAARREAEEIASSAKDAKKKLEAKAAAYVEDIKKIEEEKKKTEENTALLIEEMKKIEEEKKKAEDEKNKIEEEKKKAEDEKNKIEEEKKQAEEDAARLLEAITKQEDEKKKIEDEKNKIEEEKKKIEEEKKKIEADAALLINEMKIKEDDKKKAEEETEKAKENAIVLFEEIKRREEENKKIEDGKKKMEEYVMSMINEIKIKEKEKKEAQENADLLTKEKIEIEEKAKSKMQEIYILLNEEKKKADENAILLEEIKKEKKRQEDEKEEALKEANRKIYEKEMIIEKAKKDALDTEELQKFTKYLEGKVTELCNEKGRLETVEKELVSAAATVSSSSITSSATATSTSTGLSTTPSTMTAATVVSPTRSSNTVESATTSTTLAGTTMSAASSTPTLPVGLSHSFGVKLPTYKSPGDVEIFVNRFEQFCITHGIDENSKANLLMDALDDVTFTVIKRELSDEERKNYKKTKEHLLRRFDLVKEGGQKRLIFRQTRRAAGQTFEDFYTQLLGLAAKAFPEEGDSKYVDRAITDQFVVGCDDDRVRLHLIEKAPSSSKEALQLALTFKAALQYNETLRDASSTIGAIQQQNYYRNDWRERQRDFSNDSRSEERNGRSRETQIKERNFEGNGDEERNERWRENREFQQVDRRPRSSSPAPNFIPSYRGNQQTANNNHRTRNNYSYEGNYTRNTQYGGGNYNRNTGYDNGNYERYARQESSNYSRDTGYDNRNTDRYNRGSAGVNIARGASRGNNWRNQRGKPPRNVHFSTNSIGSPSHPFYIYGTVNNVQIPFLLDTGSAVTIIDEEIWLQTDNRKQLEKAPFAIRSVTQHTIEVLGQAMMDIKLRTKKNSIRNFSFQTLVARGLTQQAILGLDFMKAFRATVNVYSQKLDLYIGKTKSSHHLIQGKTDTRSVNVIITEKVEVQEKTEKRLECTLEEDIEDGTEVYFEADTKFLATTSIALAGAVDRVHKNNITIQLINPTCQKVSIPVGTVVGRVEMISTDQKHSVNSVEPTRFDDAQHLNSVDIGDDYFPPAEKDRIRKLLREFADIFSKNEYDLGRTGLIQHSIEIIGEKPKRCGPRPLNPAMRQELEKQVNDMLHQDLIQPSRSEYACPVVLVRKKDGTLRFCCDFRKVNDASRKDSYPLPRISEVISTLSGARVFSTLDLKSGYHQIEMNPEDSPKTAFSTQFGLFEWKVMPMGLSGSPSTFQRLMDLLMTGLAWRGVLVYLDDLLIFGRNHDEHYSNLREVLTRLRGANLKLSPKKCHILKSKVTYLGHVIQNGEVMPDPEKTRLIETFPVPVNIKQVRSFTSLASYYRKFVKNFAVIVKPLLSMLEKGKDFVWTQECQEAFETLKQRLVNETKLTLPDFTKNFRLACDASGIALGAVLSQVDCNNIERPIAFASRVLSKAERKWSVTEREAFAIVWAVNYFRQYLLGQPFELISDHKPLLWLRDIRNPTPKIARWLLQLEEYNFTIVYKEGSKNSNADVMTRLPQYDNIQAVEVIQFEADLTMEEIEQAQEENELLSIISANFDTIDTLQETYPNFKALRPFIDKKEQLFIEDNILYRQVSDSQIQVILPPCLHGRVLQILHNSPTDGHLGIERTLARFEESFYWPNSRQIVAEHIRKCMECEKFKPPKLNTQAKLQPIITQRPLELLELDFVGPLTVTQKGNRYILSVIDHFSKYAVTFATARQDSKTVIECLNNFFAHFGRS